MVWYNQNRPSYFRIISPEALQRLKENKCPNCGLSKNEWKRRTDWACCSKECTENYYKEHDQSISWELFRIKIFNRDGSTCKKCGKKKEHSELIADHIVPIALGGEMWKESNIQTLCLDCNKVKTNIDMGNIAKHRRRQKNKLRTFRHPIKFNVQWGIMDFEKGGDLDGQ